MTGEAWEFKDFLQNLHSGFLVETLDIVFRAIEEARKGRGEMA